MVGSFYDWCCWIIVFVVCINGYVLFFFCFFNYRDVLFICYYGVDLCIYREVDLLRYDLFLG